MTYFRSDHFNEGGSLVFSIAALVLIGTPAFAADMAVKAPSPAPAPVYNWTGWYVGGNIGASFGHVKTDFNADPVTVTGPSITIPGFSQSDTLYPSGFIGGGQIGYNWQFSPIWVAGLEADIQGADEKDSAIFTHPFSATPSIIPFAPPVTTATGTSVLDYTAKIDWFGTVRGRIGYVWGDGAVLTYVTGGWPTAR
jgi:outer membrane immunogenic protein